MTDHFANIPKIQYEGPTSKNFFAFKYYNAEEVVAGKKLKDWCRFAVCYWHTWRGTGADPFGEATFPRPYDDGSDSVENAIVRLRIHFALLQKLGVEYYTFHDRDVAPVGKTLQETNANLDKVVQVAKQLQEETGIKLLWGTANLFSHKRYMNGAASNPDAHVFAYAAAQVKKAIEVTHYLGGENYVFWGGREGYQTLLNTNMKKELDNMAAFFKMAVDFKNKIGVCFYLLATQSSHQYDFDVATVMNFLKTYGLENDFKVNIEANHATLSGKTFEHEVTLASQYGSLGSIDANVGHPLLGWDTDQFNLDVKSTTHIMKIIMDQGGLGSGGLNFDAKLRRESTDAEDVVLGHVGSMDAFARGVRIAAKITEDGTWDEWKKQRYASYDSGLGQKIAQNATNFEELEAYILGLDANKQEPTQKSAKQEKYELLYQSYF